MNKSKHIDWKKYTRALLLGAPLLVLVTACHSDFGPSPMPTGYKYHHDVYKAPPGPEPVFKKWQHDMEIHDQCFKEKICLPRDQMPVMIDDGFGGAHMVFDSAWDNAAHELTGRLLSGLGQVHETAYIRPPVNAEEYSFARALMRAMETFGMQVSSIQGAGPYVMDYQLMPAGTAGTRVTLWLKASGLVAGEQSGTFDAVGTGRAAPLMSVPDPALQLHPAPAPQADLQPQHLLPPQQQGADDVPY